MPVEPNGAADRWIMREGWRFMGWSVNRTMVQLHDKIGAGFLIASPFLALAAGTLIEPAAATLGLSSAIIGAVHWGVSRWAKGHDEIRNKPAPKLTRRARRLLKRLVVRCIGTDPWGQKYYGRILRPSASHLKAHCSDSLSSPAFQAMESLCHSYNRVAGALLADGAPGGRLLESAERTMADGLEIVAQVHEFPERRDVLEPRLMQITDSLNRLGDVLDEAVKDPRSLETINLDTWADALVEERSQHIDAGA
jgi:hypothetical protein